MHIREVKLKSLFQVAFKLTLGQMDTLKTFSTKRSEIREVRGWRTRDSGEWEKKSGGVQALLNVPADGQTWAFSY